MKRTALLLSALLLAATAATAASHDTTSVRKALAALIPDIPVISVGTPAGDGPCTVTPVTLRTDSCICHDTFVSIDLPDGSVMETALMVSRLPESVYINGQPDALMITEYIARCWRRGLIHNSRTHKQY